MDGDIRFYFAILSTLCNLTEKDRPLQVRSSRPQIPIDEAGY